MGDRLLLDTHIFLWMFSDPERLSDDLRRAIQDHPENAFVSSVVAWEIVIKYEIGKLDLPEPPEQYITERLRRTGFPVLPITPRHTFKLVGLPQFHKDPFDRLLIAQALAENLLVATADEAFNPYPVRTIR